jgi:hypothetical protein
MSNVMTIDEIETSFPNEWILVIEPDLGADLKVRSGRVACHSPSREEIHRTAMALHPKNSAVWYNGEDPEELIIL